MERAAFGGAVVRMGELAGDGHGTAAVRAFAGFVFDDEEIAVAVDAGYFEAAARYVPKTSASSATAGVCGARVDDPAVLRAICVPVLVLHGADTRGLFTRSARHVAGHVPNATLQAIPGAGHASPLTQPEPLAEALTGFFSPR